VPGRGALLALLIVGLTAHAQPPALSDSARQARRDSAQGVERRIVDSIRAAQRAKVEGLRRAADSAKAREARTLPARLGRIPGPFGEYSWVFFIDVVLGALGGWLWAAGGQHERRGFAGFWRALGFGGGAFLGVVTFLALYAMDQLGAGFLSHMEPVVMLGLSMLVFGPVVVVAGARYLVNRNA
jgi:hypothetical protein